MSKGKETQQIHKKGSVRHAEKRRIATCLFADRIARESIEAYNQCVPEEWRNENKQICLATFVAHFRPMSVPVSVPKDGADANTNNEDGNGNGNGDGDGNGSPCGHLQVMGLGVGTKYLSEDLIRDEQESGTGYGMRIRDLHAEVLARRAFRHKLSLEMRSLLSHREHNARAENDVDADDANADADADTKQTYRPILQFVPSENGDGGKFALVDGVTIHMYTSSTPCGNSSLKKFAKMAKEKYDASLGGDEWFMQPHSDNPAAAHSLHLGSFALLVKKDFSVQIKDVNSEQCDDNIDDNNDNDNDNDDNDNSDTAAPRCKNTKFINGYDMMSHIPRKQRMWPANQNDDWCPSGTSLPHLGKGSIHTCSDKICRWNCLGVQGSLLSSLLDTPIYITSMTVGRKFTRSIAQRALCCRAVKPIKKQSKRKRGGGDVGVDKDANVNAGRERDGVKGHDGHCNDCNQSSDFRLNHPSIMGTAVYLDDSGVLDMSGEKAIGQDVRFLSSLCWMWCPTGNGNDDNGYNDIAECVDGNSGLLFNYKYSDTGTEPAHDVTDKYSYSNASTYALTLQFLDLKKYIVNNNNEGKGERGNKNHEKPIIQTLDQLRHLKRCTSPKYETSKDDLLLKHRVFSQWNRRCYTIRKAQI